ncbi:dinucleotide-utilizing enzyme possibly involved in molybdopterin or thiamin biosynthesis [Cryptobacterium curtum DSM 15641]|uniref:Dinucleotide-utilizing enzyme possibly involved in molybdopterin or thiamin biosynthesis n=1 Tax=Cryptobacterium curtum (strain ATCC 700683 / DSM 15641 / CCUG 43107 / 12-3) TaxID=469378 RepID=C7MLB8_CRYCD|nr:ThiF family adenylyltransferase [Cryptobacterium curtum]ACU95065.1 dinucleotide-utilizing enzyme possibly involved in molybdopterin or thiamin biosynthesis [Cryptobacterium curtum DSM 15641]
MDDLVSRIKGAVAAAGYDVLEGKGINVEGSLRNGARVRMSLILPSGFPYELPEFQLDSDMLAEYGRLPHVGPTGQICAFDRETNIPCPSRPEGQVIEVLNKTLEILSDGIEGKNADDYLDEFLAYWGYGQETILPLYSLVDSMGNCPRILSVYASNQEQKQLFICENKEEAVQLAARMGDLQEEQSFLRCLYIPLSSPIAYPFPETHKEWFDLIHKDDLCFSEYEKFVQSSDRQKSVVVFSCPYLDGRRVFAAFEHDGLPSASGFRRGKVPLEVGLCKIGENKVVRYDYVDASQSRLYCRGGTGLIARMKACVIGCGSLGGFLVGALVACGVDDFVLIDNQTLGVENIARHLCGFKDVGKPKAEAVKGRIISDNPNIKCKVYSENANSLIEAHSNSISSSDYVFVTVGSYPLERHVIEKALELNWSARVVLMWVEPFAIAAHALVLNKPQDVHSKMFDSEGRFVGSVVANSNELFKREAGCQSTYVPYSGLDVESFLNDFARSLVRGRLDKHNYHYAWYGALSQADMFGVIVKPEHADRFDYTSEAQRID